MCNKENKVDEIKSSGSVILCFFFLGEIGNFVEILKWLNIDVFMERNIIELILEMIVIFKYGLWYRFGMV